MDSFPADYFYPQKARCSGCAGKLVLLVSGQVSTWRPEIVQTEVGTVFRPTVYVYGRCSRSGVQW